MLLLSKHAAPNWQALFKQHVKFPVQVFPPQHVPIGTQIGKFFGEDEFVQHSCDAPQQILPQHLLASEQQCEDVKFPNLGSTRTLHTESVGIPVSHAQESDLVHCPLMQHVWSDFGQHWFPQQVEEGGQSEVLEQQNSFGEHKLPYLEY